MAIANMPLGTAVIFAITAGLTTGLGILASCVLTSGAITARAGRRPSPSGAVMAILARGSALVIPAALLAVGSAVVTLAVQLNSGTLQRSDFNGTGGTNGAAGAAHDRGDRHRLRDLLPLGPLGTRDRGHPRGGPEPPRRDCVGAAS